MENGLSLGEAMALTDRRDEGLFGGNSWWIFILFFFWIFMFNGKDDTSGIATRAAVTDGFQYNQLDNSLRQLQAGLSEGMYALNSAIKDCCCTTQRSIDGVKYDMSRGFCDVITAGNLNTRDILENQTAGVQRILDYLCANEKEELRNRIATLETTALIQNQSKNLVDQLKPYPIPAYLTASPYAGAYGYGVGYGCSGTTVYGA